MALMKCNFFSQALGRCTNIYVVLPQKFTQGQIGVETKCEEEKFKSILLLHGLSDDESCWLRRTSIERYAAEYGVAVIMPCAEKSFYTDMNNGDAFYTYIAKEVPKIAREFFNISEKREDTFIMGQSMGGYGALKIALRENNTFSRVVAFSSVADIVERSIPKGEDYRDFKNELIPVFGADMNIPKEDDLFELSKMKAETETMLPKILMMCGTEDYMYQDNLKLKEHFEKLPYDYKFVEAKGHRHNWVYWDIVVQDALKWLL